MKNIMLILLFLGLNSCSSDVTKNLGDGYFYNDEGDDIKDILCRNPHGGEIPATILDYAYNGNFILAKQIPKIPQDILYDKEYEYKDGHNAVYYWIIDKTTHIVYGPLDVHEYGKLRKKLNIEDKFHLKTR